MKCPICNEDGLIEHTKTRNVIWKGFGNRDVELVYSRCNKCESYLVDGPQSTKNKICIQKAFDSIV